MKTPGAPAIVWQLMELTNGAQLRSEATALHHCVASYADRCWRGASRILSLRVHRREKVRHLLTIEVDMQRRAVVQARGWRNRAPSGRSLPKQIAKALNAEGVRGPRGALWSPSTIHGNPERGIGILHNELYIGRLVWNRQRFLKDPDNGKRVARANPPSEWITKDVPELRIIDDEVWQAVQARYASVQRIWKAAREGRPQMQRARAVAIVRSDRAEGCALVRSDAGAALARP